MPVKPIKAPVGGWNASDALDGMKEEDAIKLENWYPTTDGVETRKGHEVHLSGLSDKVETLVEYHGTDGTRRLIAASGAIVYNATSAATSIGTGFSSAQWQTVQKDGVMLMVNGADAPQSYDGSTLGAATISGSGLTVANLIDCTSYFSRNWFVEKDTANAWYTALNAPAGALTKFPLEDVTKMGGYLMKVDTWSRDSGDGPDDYIVFIMSTGEILVYGGDPSTTFSIVGRFYAPEPLSRRCTLKFGANLWIMTRGGVVSLEAIMALGNQAVDKAITTKIKEAFRSKADAFGVQFGWMAHYYPKREMVLFNVPTGTNLYQQYVVNTLTGAWCSFKGMNSFSWSNYNGDLYFGGDTYIYKADTGNDDNGSDIVFDAITAFTYLGNYGQKKQITMVQPSLRLDGNLQNNITIGTDFEIPAEPSDIEVTQSGGTPWGSPWGSPWSGQPVIEDNFIGVSGYGYNVAIRLKISTSEQQTKWYSTRWAFKPGGLI